METNFTIFVILLVFVIATAFVLKHRRKFSVKKMISAASRSDEYVFLYFLEKEKPSYFGCVYDVVISNQDNVQLMYKLYVNEGGNNDEIVNISCIGFLSYTICYNNGQIYTETLPGINMTTEDCEDILALARFAFQKALRTYQAK